MDQNDFVYWFQERSLKQQEQQKVLAPAACPEQTPRRPAQKNSRRGDNSGQQPGLAVEERRRVLI